jgi:hypothetical protein
MQASSAVRRWPNSTETRRLLEQKSVMRLFVTVFFDVRLRSLHTLMGGMMGMALGNMGVVGRLFVMPTRMMLCRFPVMFGRVFVMFRRFIVVFYCFLGHELFLLLLKRNMRTYIA